MPCVIPSPWVWVRSVTLLLTNRMVRKKWKNDVMPLSWLHKITVSILLTDWLPWWLQESKWPLKSPHGKKENVALGQQLGTDWGSYSNRYQETEFWQWPHEAGSRSFFNHLVRSDRSPSQHHDCSLAKTSLSHAQTPDLQKLHDDKCVLFLVTTFVIILLYNSR